MPAALHFTADAEANRLLADGAARRAARHAARPAGHDGVGVRRAAAVEAAARRSTARRGRDRRDGPGATRGGLPRQARAAPLPGVDGQAHARPLPLPRRALRRADRGDLDGARARATSCSRACIALPGFGKDKSRIFVGLLGKRLGVRPPGWEAVAADWPSIADVDTFERVAEIREKKRAAKAAKKAGAPKQTGAPKKPPRAKQTAKAR